MAQFIVVSNRGPASATIDTSGEIVMKRGAGGLVTAFLPLIKQELAKWLFPISSKADTKANEYDLFSKMMPGLKPVELPVEIHDSAYNKISNEILWYLNHGMFSPTRTPSFDSSFYLLWEHYCQYSQILAHAIAELADQSDKILLQDYHMFLVARALKQLRPDLEIALFLHTPFANTSEFKILPNEVASQILESLSLLDHLGFHAQMWKNNYLETTMNYGITPAKNVWVNPLGSDVDELNGALIQVASKVNLVDDIAKGRRIIARSDRMEPSKNILRGIDSVVEMFRFYPHLLSTTVHIANCYSSREAILDYQLYASEVFHKVKTSNEYLVELARNCGIVLDSSPIVLFSEDDFYLSVALLSRYDVLLVNPIRDGLNLVATEGPIINQNDGTLVLSQNAGVAEYLSNEASLVNPFDVRETAQALYDALTLGSVERHQKSASLRNLALERSPQTWFSNQIAWFTSEN